MTAKRKMLLQTNQLKSGQFDFIFKRYKFIFKIFCE
jgi:hypothetical protein